MLCQRGSISFPDAWKLLREARLQRPEHELPRAAWTALLGHAHTTAEEHPEQAAMHQKTLWEATKDPSARVCLPSFNTNALSGPSQGPAIRAMCKSSAFAPVILIAQLRIVTLPFWQCMCDRYRKVTFLGVLWA